MSQSQDSHKDHGGHGGGGIDEWLVNHMSGIIMPFGKVFERCMEQIMFFLVNDFFRKVAIVYLVIFSPILLVEFLVRFIQL